MKTSNKIKKRLKILIPCLLLLLIGSCLFLELCCQDKLRTGITVNVITSDKMQIVDEDLMRNLDAFLNPLNVLSYFTQLSNTLCVLWSIFFVLFYFLRYEKGVAFCLNSTLLISLTTYVTIAGGAVACTMLMGLSRFQRIANVWSFIYNWISVVYHFITPLLMWLFCRLFITAEKRDRRRLPLLFVFPVVYAVFTFVRGIFIRPGLYPYFIFSPKNVWQIIGGGKPLNYPLAYLAMAVIFAVGAAVFYAVGNLAYLLLKSPSEDKIANPES